MRKSIKINSGSIIPTDTIRFIRPIDEQERARIAERYGVDGANFNTSIQFADKSTKLAVETLDELRAQGLPLVDIGADRHVVATNIRSADPFTHKDATALADKGGYTITQEFKSRVETSAGTVLSSLTPEQVVDRRGRAIDTATNGPKPQPNGA